MKILPLLAAAALLPLAACGTSEPTADPTPTATVTETVTPTATATTPPATPGEVAACAGDRFVTTLVSKGSGAGSSFYEILASNAAQVPCTIPSDPPVLQFTAGDKLVGPASKSEATETGVIELGDQMGITAAVRVGSVGPYDAADCKPVPVDGIRVTIGDAVKNLDYEGQACSGDIALLDVESFAGTPQKQH